MEGNHEIWGQTCDSTHIVELNKQNEGICLKMNVGIKPTKNRESSKESGKVKPISVR